MRRTAKPPVRQRRLTADEIPALVKAYEDGAGTVALATRYGMSRDAVWRQLRSAGVVRPQTGLTTDQVAEAIRLRAEGGFYRQIAERFGVDTETVRRHVLRGRSS